MYCTVFLNYTSAMRRKKHNWKFLFTVLKLYSTCEAEGKVGHINLLPAQSLSRILQLYTVVTKQVSKYVRWLKNKSLKKLFNA